MNQAIVSAASALCKLRSVDHGYVVSTTNLLPSGSVVKLHIIAGKKSFQISDRGLAVTEIEDTGAHVVGASRLLRRYANRYGIDSSSNELYVSCGMEDLSASIILVANAVSDAVREEIRRVRFDAHRDLRAALSDYLRGKAGELADNRRSVAGKYAQHEFQHVFESALERRLVIVDPVLLDASSINSRVVAHLDVKAELGPAVEGLLVYDDSEDWTTDKLGLLRLAADIVPFSRIDQALMPRLPLH